MLDVRQRVPHDEFATLIERIRVEHELVWVHEAGDQDAMANQDAAAFAPNLAYIGDEEGRDRVHDQVEARVADAERSAMSPCTSRNSSPSRSATRASWPS